MLSELVVGGRPNVWAFRLIEGLHKPCFPRQKRLQRTLAGKPKSIRTASPVLFLLTQVTILQFFFVTFIITNPIMPL